MQLTRLYHWTIDKIAKRMPEEQKNRAKIRIKLSYELKIVCLFDLGFTLD